MLHVLNALAKGSTSVEPVLPERTLTNLELAAAITDKRMMESSAASIAIPHVLFATGQLKRTAMFARIQPISSPMEILVPLQLDTASLLDPFGMEPQSEFATLAASNAKSPQLFVPNAWSESTQRVESVQHVMSAALPARLFPSTAQPVPQDTVWLEISALPA
jgi:hypothetical protein